MALDLEHIVLFELLQIPCSSLADKKLLSMSRAFHYSGCFPDLYGLVQSGKVELTIEDTSYLTNAFSVRSDKERFDESSFCLVDVDQKRLVIYVTESREPFFLFIVPSHLKEKSPWEVLFKSCHSTPLTLQVHFEFVADPILPNWYEQKRLCSVKKSNVLPLMGKNHKLQLDVLLT